MLFDTTFLSETEQRFAERQTTREKNGRLVRAGNLLRADKPERVHSYASSTAVFGAPRMRARTLQEATPCHGVGQAELTAGAVRVWRSALRSCSTCSIISAGVIVCRVRIDFACMIG